MPCARVPSPRLASPRIPSASHPHLTMCDHSMIHLEYYAECGVGVEIEVVGVDLLAIDGEEREEEERDETCQHGD